MENASKAIIISGTFLIILLIITVGMNLFDKGTETNLVMQANLSQEEILAFNQRFLKYDNEQFGTSIKELIVAVNKANAETKLDDIIINGFVNKGNDNKYYPTAGIINSEKYIVEFGYNQGGIINQVTITK